jgi:hypothetical protein
MSKSSALSAFPATSRHRFRIQRACKALDDGKYRKWILVVKGSDLPLRLPLDANARLPNILRNGTCKEMRETLLKQPELFQILNGGTICIGSAAEVVEENGEKFVEIAFSSEASQGIVNGGHTYATLLHFLQGETLYSGGDDLKEVLIQDAKGNAGLFEYVSDDSRLQERISHARDHAHVQLEFVMPISNAEDLEKIARARNLSQAVEATALANLAGRFNVMRSTLQASSPEMQAMEQRVVWKTNQEVADDGKAVSAKSLINLLAMMDFHKFPIDQKPANAVYGHASVVIRDFADAEGKEKEFQDRLTALLPKFVELYDEIYATLPLTDSKFAWDGKFGNDKPRKAAKTPFLGKLCVSKVVDAYIWPIFASLRALLREDPETKTLEFLSDPIQLFNDMKGQMAARTMSYHDGVVKHVGKDKEIWLRLEGDVANELRHRERMAQK